MQDKSESELWTGVWKIETDELLMVATSVRMHENASDSGMPEFITFTKSESIRPTNEAYIEQ